MDNWIVVSKFDWNSLPLEKLVKMLPVVNFLIQFKSIVKLVHLDLLWVVPAEYFSKDPSVRKVSFWVRYFVGEVERLHPHVQFTNILGGAADAQIKTTKSQMKLLESALDMYKLDNFRYPTTEQGLEALIAKPSSSPEPKNYRSGGYLKGNSVPQDAWGTEFLYFAEKGKYEIVSLGADGEDGGEEADADIVFPE